MKIKLDWYKILAIIIMVASMIIIVINIFYILYG